jgi:hypothetical protein
MRKIEVLSVEKSVIWEQTFNLTTQNHEYIANGFVVHKYILTPITSVFTLYIKYALFVNRVEALAGHATKELKDG